MSRVENQFSVIGYSFVKIFVIASSDLSERGNLGLGLLPPLSRGQAYFVPRNDISVFSF